MRRTSTLILFAAIVLVGWVIYLGNSQEQRSEVEALARREARRQAEVEAKSERNRTDLDTLARAGKGQQLPPHLVARPAGGAYWFVGKPESDFGVEIPFKPGTLPVAPSDDEPLHANPGFLGADACRECHQEKYETFIETAHHRTSRVANAETISASFEPPDNLMRTASNDVYFRMIERDGDFFQRVSFFDWQFDVPLHLIIGSSKMAETYLYWHDDKLFQLNCTYLSEPDTWINSPGYLDGDAAYARKIPPGCVECHATYADLREYPNHYTPSSLILGVSCERCHGTGKAHVDFHAAHPDETKARHVSVPSTLSRQAQLDVCGQCHAPRKSPKVEGVFQFRPGDRLEDFYELADSDGDGTNTVHASNQIARLSLSECFKQSEMACSECHDPHHDERGKTALFSQRCMVCHPPDHCSMSEQLGERLSENCIDCHMPKRASINLRLATAEGSVFPPLRDHYIRIDEQATHEYLESLRGKKTE